MTKTVRLACPGCGKKCSVVMDCQGVSDRMAHAECHHCGLSLDMPVVETVLDFTNAKAPPELVDDD